jgi:uncharacterized protein
MTHPDAELDKLQDLLFALPAENDPMSLPELDGLVAGVLVCPDMIPPSEWLPEVWGAGEGASFDTLEQAQAIIPVVTEHYNRVARVLASGAGRYEALMGIDPNSDEMLWEPWVSGFERAMRLRPDSWERIIDSDDEEAASSVTMILALHEIDIGTSELDEDSVKQLDELAPKMIPQFVAALNEWTKAHATPATASHAGHFGAPGGRKVGRNDPCPCGSGLKFKKCCGGVTWH